ncbi:MAG: DeoR/GlpR transcriptional regulator [Clostridiales bacterium]|nr:DeoR/GlpR transcriptional regulator [Clostridiales bacterium]
MKKTELKEKKLIEYLSEHKRISLSEAINLLDVSESTVRRVFVRLEEKGKGVRDYGGIKLAGDAQEYCFDSYGEKKTAEKKAVAAIAVRLVESSDIIYLDSGTTLAIFAQSLAEQIKEGGCEGVTIFTNSIVNLERLHEVAKVNLIGGEYRSNRRDLCGYLAEEAIKRLHFSKCFLGTDGFSPTAGFTATDFSTARLNELVLQSSQKSFILLDSGKFHTRSVVSYSKGSMVSAVVTEVLPEQEIQALLANEGIEIITNQ